MTFRIHVCREGGLLILYHITSDIMPAKHMHVSIVGMLA